MTEYLSLGIFAFLWVGFTLFRHLMGPFDYRRSHQGEKSMAADKNRRGIFFIFRVAVPLVVGILFFSYGVSLWDPAALEARPVAIKGEFLTHSLSYLDTLEEMKLDPSPLAWHEVAGFRPEDEKLDLLPLPERSNPSQKSSSPTQVMKTFWSLS